MRDRDRDRDRDGDRDKGRGRGERCRFCRTKFPPDYKDVDTLQRLMTGQGKMYSRKRSGWNSVVVTDIGSQLFITCGPYRIEWSHSDWLYIPSGDPSVEMAVTPWVQVEDIDFDDPNLKWQTATDPL